MTTPKIVCLGTNRDFYDATEAANESCTISEFITFLEEFDPNSKIIYKNDGGFTYGAIYL